MQAITTIGLDIAKSIFQVHGIDTEGKVVFRRQLKWRYVVAFFQKLPPCLCSGDLVATSRMFGRVTASQIASASVASFLCRFTYGFT